MAISSPEPITIESVDQQQESCELVKLIRKLRWIGMEREAELVARAVVGRLAIGSPVVGPSDTD
jgi:hypothetical protein